MSAARKTDRPYPPARLRRLALLTGLFVAGCTDDRQPATGPQEFAREATPEGEVLHLPTRCTGEGLWDSDITDDSEGLPIGCTTSRNLSAMIDDPEDLSRGRPLGPAAAAPAAELARDYLSRFSDRTIGVPEDEPGESAPPPVASPKTEGSPESAPDQTYEE